MRVEVSRSYEFQAAHFLPRVPTAHKCSRMHGHTWTATIALIGELDPGLGWLCDFGFLDAFWTQTCHPLLDHRTLNDVMENPTSENVAAWILDRARCVFDPGLVARVTVSENGRSTATVFA